MIDPIYEFLLCISDFLFAAAEETLWPFYVTSHSSASSVLTGEPIVQSLHDSAYIGNFAHIVVKFIPK